MDSIFLNFGLSTHRRGLRWEKDCGIVWDQFNLGSIYKRNFKYESL